MIYGDLAIIMNDKTVCPASALQVGDKTFTSRVEYIKIHTNFEEDYDYPQVLQVCTQHFVQFIVTRDQVITQGLTATQLSLQNSLSNTITPFGTKRIPKEFWDIMKKGQEIRASGNLAGLVRLCQEYKPYIPYIFSPHPDEAQDIWTEMSMNHAARKEDVVNHATLLWRGHEAMFVMMAMQHLGFKLGIQTKTEMFAQYFKLHKIGVCEPELTFSSPIETIRIFYPKKRNRLIELRTNPPYVLSGSGIISTE